MSPDLTFSLTTLPVIVVGMNHKGRIHFIALVTVIFGTLNSLYAADLPDLAKLKLAAEAGDAYAQFKLAGHYDDRMDSTQAEVWLRKSAGQGFAPAQGELGSRLLRRYRSLGQPAESKAASGKEAITWLAAGAVQGDVQAQGNLASAILEGKLVKQDLVAVYKWGSLAAQGPPLNTGTMTGKSARDAAILKMNAGQIKAAEKMVAEFKPKITELPKPADKTTATTPEPQTKPEIAKGGPTGIPHDLAKQENYFSSLYGPAKSERHLKAYQFMLPEYDGQVQIEQPFLLREYSSNKISVKVLFSEATEQAVWVEYHMFTAWKDEETNAALKAYGSDWNKTRLNLGASLLVPDIAPTMYRSASGIVVYRTLLNQLMVYAPALYADLSARAEERERQKQVPPKF